MQWKHVDGLSWMTTWTGSTWTSYMALQGLRRTLLATADAHELYRSYGFEDLVDPSRFLGVQRDAASLYGQV